MACLAPLVKGHNQLEEVFCMFHLKRNLPGWERGTRIALAAVVAGAAATGIAMGLLTSPVAWAARAVALTLMATAVIGFCPACAMCRSSPRPRWRCNWA